MSALPTRAQRLVRPLLYATAAGVAGTTILYFVYRPRDIPGSEAAAVPPPMYGEAGEFRLPDFPVAISRSAQIARLRRSDASNEKMGSGEGWKELAKKTFSDSNEPDGKQESESDDDAPYDLLIIGGGATGAGIALDAVTRGLKVAMVERDDFSSGTSSKSTKLVHGGVRYLEKAVWELDYSQ